MTHGSLFSGVGGFDLAAEWMGWENKFHCENNPFCQQVLNYYWPNAKSYGDIKETDFAIWRGLIDVVSGGFPCQPYSLAGKRKGNQDDRHLWPFMLAAIKSIQPRWVVGENVLGLINWSKGLVFHEVQTDLEASGYEVWPYVLPACGIGAPHRRERIWFVAHRHGEQFDVSKEQRRHRQAGNPNIGGNAKNGDFTHCNGKGFQVGVQPLEWEIKSQAARFKERSMSTRIFTKSNWEQFPTQPPIFSRNDGLSSKLAGITISKHRNESIKGYGNAIVPQVAYEIFKTIEQYENLNHSI